MEGRAAQLDRPAVEHQIRAVGAHLAQADVGAVAGLAGHLELEVPQVRRRRRPQVRVRDLHLRVQHLRAAGGQRLGRELELDLPVAAHERALDADLARLDVVAQVDLHVHVGRAVGGQLRVHLRVADLARADAADRDAAVDAAEVEPQPVPAVALHRGRAVPVRAHDEVVRHACRELHAHLERQVLALVLALELAVDVDARTVVDGLELDDVGPVDRDRDVRAVPADAALERVLALAPRDLRRVGHERHAHELATLELAELVALVEADVVGILAKAPAAVELHAVAGAAIDRRWRAVGGEDDAVDGRVRCGRRHGHEPGHRRQHRRYQDAYEAPDYPTAHSSLFCVMSRSQRRGHARNECGRGGFIAA